MIVKQNIFFWKRKKMQIELLVTLLCHLSFLLEISWTTPGDEITQVRLYFLLYFPTVFLRILKKLQIMPILHSFKTKKKLPPRLHWCTWDSERDKLNPCKPSRMHFTTIFLFFRLPVKFKQRCCLQKIFSLKKIFNSPRACMRAILGSQILQIHPKMLELASRTFKSLRMPSCRLKTLLSNFQQIVVSLWRKNESQVKC